MEVETRQPCVLPVNGLVYADDTLVVARDPCRTETHMRRIEAMGMKYGLRLNWKKCEVLPIGCEASIAAPDGSYLTCKSSISYLGSYLDATGAGGPEICRRLGEAKGRESGGILPCTPNKRSVSSKLVSCQSCCIACTQCGWIRRNYGKLMGSKQSASVLSFISHLRTSVGFQMQQCCREATANACPPSWDSDSYVYFNPLQCYLMMMFADDAFSNLVALFCKTCQLHAAGVAPNKYGLAKCIERQWKLLKVLTC